MAEKEGGIYLPQNVLTRVSSSHPGIKVINPIIIERKIMLLLDPQEVEVIRDALISHNEQRQIFRKEHKGVTTSEWDDCDKHIRREKDILIGSYKFYDNTKQIIHQ